MRELSLFSLEMWKLQWDLVAFQYLESLYKRQRRIFYSACSDRTKSDGFKLKDHRFLVGIRKKYHTMSVVKYVFQRSYRCPTFGSVWGQVRWGFEHPKLVKDALVHSKSVGQDYLWRSFPTQTCCFQRMLPLQFRYYSFPGNGTPQPYAQPDGRRPSALISRERSQPSLIPAMVFFKPFPPVPSLTRTNNSLGCWTLSGCPGPQFGTDLGSRLGPSHPKCGCYSVRGLLGASSPCTG